MERDKSSRGAYNPAVGEELASGDVLEDRNTPPELVAPQHYC
jgi:hypothetical protein